MRVMQEQNNDISQREKAARWREWQKKYVRPFKIYLQLERGLSANTMDAYMRDLDKLLSFLAVEDREPAALTIDDLHAFAAGLYDIGLDARSQARIL